MKSDFKKKIEFIHIDAESKDEGLFVAGGFAAFECLLSAVSEVHQDQTTSDDKEMLEESSAMFGSLLAQDKQVQALFQKKMKNVYQSTVQLATMHRMDN